MLFDHIGNLLDPAAEATARAEIAAGTRLMRTDSAGDHLLAPDAETTLRAEWQAAQEASSIAAAARAAELADTDAARQFARLVALRGMTPAQFSAWHAQRYPGPAANLADTNALLAKVIADIETLGMLAILAKKL